MISTRAERDRAARWPSPSGRAPCIRMIGRSGGVAIVADPSLHARRRRAGAARAHLGDEPDRAHRDAAVAAGQHRRRAQLPVGSGRSAPPGRDLHSIDLPCGTCPPGSAPSCRCSRSRPSSAALAVLIGSPFAARRRVPDAAPRPLVPITLQAVVLPLAIVSQRRRALRRHPPRAVRDPRAARHSRRSRSPCSSGNRPAAARCGRRLPLAAVVVVAASLLASIRWAPYAYAYLNPIAGANKDGLSWELDYWGVSGKEGVERLRKLGYDPVAVTADGRRRDSLGSGPRRSEARHHGRALRLPPR